MDDARKWTDAELDALEKRMAKEYRQAAKEMRDKQEKWLAKFDREREQREKALDDTDEVMQAHKRWLQSQATREQWFSDMVDGLSESAHRANQRAADMVNDHLPRVYAENANRAAFDVDKAVRADTRFTLVNEDAIRYLMGGMEEGQLLKEVTPTPHMNRVAMGLQSMRRDVDPVKDIRWNRQKFASAITQGILQGESIPNIVKRTESVFGQNRDAAFRAARTATTSAENAGRMSSFERAERLGIDMEIEWLATLDGRTRSSHRALDGERVKTGERFSNGLRWPGDPTGPGYETWNCRCRANGRVVGFDGKRGDWADNRGERWSRLPKGMTYEQWKKAKPVTSAESYLNDWGRVTGEWHAERAAESASASQVPDISTWASVSDFDAVNASYIDQLSDDLDELRAIPDSTVAANETTAFSKAETPLRFMLRDYWGSMKFQAVNGELRGHMADDVAEYAAKVSRSLSEDMGYTLKEGIELGKRAIAETELDSPIVVHRYIRESNESVERAFKAGAKFKDMGFVSTTTVDHGNGVYFVGQVPAYVTHIYVPPGKGRGIPAQAVIDEVPHCSNYRGPRAKREDEFTLAPGTTFEVLRVEGSEVWMTVID